MSNLMDLPVALAQAAAVPVAKSVARVAREIAHTIVRTELEPAWVTLANEANHPDEGRFGLLGTSGWPQFLEGERLNVSVSAGDAGQWSVCVDHVDARSAVRVTPLVRIKVLAREHAWTISAVVSSMFEID